MPEHQLKRPLYCGRFAPSPSGQLHFGSLIAALGSYLDARSHIGTWLVRIEDIDPPREMKGADSLILQALESFGLHWDGCVLYQSSRLQEYEKQLQQMLAQGAAYYCSCTRKRIKELGGVYDCHCRNLNLPAKDCAVRFKHQFAVESFEDLRLGKIELSKPWVQEDFIIKRRDGLYAYQLAVVLDDLAQGVNHVVRGRDLLEATAWQIALYRHFKQTPPAYLHLPLALDQNGQKLSKQNHAPALDLKNPQQQLCQALEFLGLEVPKDLQGAKVAEVLLWAVENWRLRIEVAGR